MATITAPAPPEVARKAAARTADAVKVYGKGLTEVRALDGVTVDMVLGLSIYFAASGREVNSTLQRMFGY